MRLCPTQEREAKYEAEQERIRREKEKEMARLRATQERAQDHQAEQVSGLLTRDVLPFCLTTFVVTTPAKWELSWMWWICWGIAALDWHLEPGDVLEQCWDRGKTTVKCFHTSSLREALHSPSSVTAIPLWQDALRAKRSQEAAEREWRRREKEAAQKKAEVEQTLKRNRLEQIAQREHSMAVQVQQDRQEFERILR